MLKKTISKMLELLIRAAITISVTVPFAKVLTDAAFRERGYSAVGGEWILISMIWAALWTLSGFIISPESEKKKARKPHREDSNDRTQNQHSGRGQGAVCDNIKLELNEVGQAEPAPHRNSHS